MELALNGKTAIVCGSTQGIGWASANELALLGANVYLFARDKEKLAGMVGQLPNQEGQTHGFLVADFDYPNLVKDETERFLKSTNQVHILVNNSGGPKAGTALNADLEDFRIAFNRHVMSSQVLIQELVPLMKVQGFGRIINIISTSVKTPIKGLGVSNTIRGAVANWSKTLSLELAPFGITVNNVLPGYTKTGRLDSIFNTKAEKESKTVEEIKNQIVSEIPAQRLGKAEEVAAAVAFLATPAAAYINGINIPVDGGRTPSL